MSKCLPDEEAAQLRFEFEAELARSRPPEAPRRAGRSERAILARSDGPLAAALQAALSRASSASNSKRSCAASSSGRHFDICGKISC
jgi:hypothetical protein